MGAADVGSRPATPPVAASTEAPGSGEYSALQAVLPHILRSFRREPALALTVAYLLIALAGIYYDYGFYQRGFGIPVLTLSQVGDFLVAGLQQPIALVLLVSTLPLCWLFDRLNTRSRRKSAARRDRLRGLAQLNWWQKLRLRFIDWHLGTVRWTLFFYALLVFIYGWNFIVIYAGHRINAVKRGDVPRVAIHLVGQPGDLHAADPKGWGYLGAVSNYVFVYDPAAKRALVLPVNAIERIQPEALKRQSGLPFPVVELH